MAAAQVGSSGPAIPHSGGGQQLATDAELAFVLINEARYRALNRVFGCTREQSNVITWVLLLTLAQDLSHGWQIIKSGPPIPPAVDELFGVVCVREALSSAAGPEVRDTPQLGNLLLAAVVLGSATPVLIRSVRAARAASHRVRNGMRQMNTGFRHRYGYLVDVGHRRARHFEARTRATLGDGQPDAVRLGDGRPDAVRLPER